MSSFPGSPSRRRFVGRAAAALAGGGAVSFFTLPGLFADELARTPPQTEGPFYPDKLPLDTDNDLHHHQRRASPRPSARSRT